MNCLILGEGGKSKAIYRPDAEMWTNRSFIAEKAVSH